jgi:hypothetical protein
LEAELVHAKQAWHNIAGELEHQKELTNRTIQSFANPPPSQGPTTGGATSSATTLNQISAKDYGVIVSEMARYRGDASRLEVELITSNQRCDLLEIRIRELSNEVCLLPPSLLTSRSLLFSRSTHRCTASMSWRSETKGQRSPREPRGKRPLISRSNTKERSLVAPPAACHPVLLCDSGSEAEQLRGEMKISEKKIAELEASISQFKEIAEIATQQAQTMSDFRDNYEVPLSLPLSPPDDLWEG